MFLGRTLELLGLASETLLPSLLFLPVGWWPAVFRLFLRPLLLGAGGLDQSPNGPEDGHRDDEKDVDPFLGIALSQVLRLCHPIEHAVVLSKRVRQTATLCGLCFYSVFFGLAIDSRICVSAPMFLSR